MYWSKPGLTGNVALWNTPQVCGKHGYLKAFPFTWRRPVEFSCKQMKVKLCLHSVLLSLKSNKCVQCISFLIKGFFFSAFAGALLE